MLHSGRHVSYADGKSVPRHSGTPNPARIEYDPQPPYSAGSPESAEPSLVAKLRASAATRQAERQAAVDQAAAKLRGDGEAA